MKKILFISIICLTFIFLTAFKVENYDNDILSTDSKSAVLIEPTTMTVIYERNPHLKLAPASMTKIMTMLLVMEALENKIITLDQKLIASEYATKMGGTQIYLEVGEEMTVRDLLKSVAVGSANDASVVLAEGISGTVDNFVNLMNKKANELGLEHTNFKNPNGLPEEGHYSCAMDMAVLSAYLINNYSEILDYTSIYEDYVREDSKKRFWLVNKNKLIKFVEGVDGLKTGWTNEAGYCLTATMKKNNIRMIAVAMGNTDPSIRNKEVSYMLSYGVNNFEIIPLYKEGDIIETYQNIDLLPTKYHIIVTKDVNILKKKSEDIGEIKTETIINFENIDGITNSNIGKINIYIGDSLYQEVELDILENVKKASFLDVFLEIVKDIFLISK